MGARAWRASTHSSTRSIRARGCTTPIVMLSGHAEPDDQQRAVQAGLRFLRKPVSFTQFEAAMAEVVEHAGAAR